MKTTKKIPCRIVSAVICLLCALGLTAYLGVVFTSSWEAEPIYPGPGVTEVKLLSDYYPALQGTAADTEVYVLDSGVPGGSMLVLGGTHPNEPSGVVAAISAMWHSPKLKRVWQIVGTVWFVIIAVSTLLVKQHAFIDLAAALVWGAVVYAIVYVIIGHKRDRKGLRCGAEEPEREAEHDYSPDAGI